MGETDQRLPRHGPLRRYSMPDVFHVEHLTRPSPWNAGPWWFHVEHVTPSPPESTGRPWFHVEHSRCPGGGRTPGMIAHAAAPAAELPAVPAGAGGVFHVEHSGERAEHRRYQAAGGGRLSAASHRPTETGARCQRRRRVRIPESSPPSARPHCSRSSAGHRSPPDTGGSLTSSSPPLLSSDDPHRPVVVGGPKLRAVTTSNCWDRSVARVRTSPA